MKLLWVVKNFPPSMGGVQQYSFHYVLNMPSGSCIVLTRKQENENEKEVSAFDNVLSQKQQTVYRIPAIPDDLGIFSVFKHPLHFFSFCVTMFIVIKKEKISHVIFAHPPFFYFFSLLPMKILSRLPFLCIFHGEDIPTINLKSNGLFRWLIKRLDGYICNSFFTHGRLQVFLGSQFPECIAFPGVEEKFFQPFDEKKCKQQFGVEGKKVLYTVGRLDERKGHDLVIKSLPAIIERVADVVYLIGGKGPHLSKLKSLVDELHLHDYVKFCGFIAEKDIVAFYHAGDVFVMLNRILPDGDTEGFGIVFLEAFASGKPVIGGRAGGAVEAVEDGVTGYIVNPYETYEFVEKVTYLLANPDKAEAMGEEGKKRAWNRFRWPVLAEKFENELNPRILC